MIARISGNHVPVILPPGGHHHAQPGPSQSGHPHCGHRGSGPGTSEQRVEFG